jgi:hypothetical protein
MLVLPCQKSSLRCLPTRPPLHELLPRQRDMCCHWQGFKIVSADMSPTEASESAPVPSNPVAAVELSVKQVMTTPSPPTLPIPWPTVVNDNRPKQWSSLGLMDFRHPPVPGARRPYQLRAQRPMIRLPTLRNTSARLSKTIHSQSHPILSSHMPRDRSPNPATQ